MEGYEVLGFFGTLRECKKAISNPWKLITVITTVSILLDSLLLLSTKSCTKTTTGDLLSLSTPNSTNLVDSFEKIKKDVQILIGFGFLSLLHFLAIYLLSLVTVILATISYRIKNLSFEDFLSIIPKLWLTTLFGSFHLILFMIGYISLFSALLISLMIVPMDHLLVLIPIVVTFGLFAFIFWMYLAVIFNIVLVISVIEKGGCALQSAQDKAKPLVTDNNRLHGIFQILSFTTSLLTVIICIVMLRGDPHQKPIWTKFIHELFSKFFDSLVAIIYFSSCIIYFQCKKTQDKEIDELQGSLEDGRIRNHSCTDANWNRLLVMLLFAGVIYGIWYKLIFQSKSADADQMFDRIFASYGVIEDF